MVSEKDFHTEEVEFSTTPPHFVSRHEPKINPGFFGIIPNWLNLMSYPLRAIYFYLYQFGKVSFKVDKNLPSDLKIYYCESNNEWVAFSEKVLLETSKDRQPIVVSPGVYNNAETDQYFIRKYNAKVIGVDPTPFVPRYIDYCYKIGYFTKEQYILEPSALSSKVGTTKFSFGDDEMGTIGANKKTQAKVKTVDLNYIVDKYKLPAIDLLQIDIEGGEYDVIEHFEDITVPIPQICIEFHSGSVLSISGILKKQMTVGIKKMRELGYRVVACYEPWYRAGFLFQCLLIHQDYLK